MADYEISFVQRMTDIDRAEWDALAGPLGTPLLSWGLLALLEESGSICPGTGWTPAHLLVRRQGELVAAAPFYVKTHSWGEFVFDFEFAEVAQRSRSTWYPKLVGMVPATPVPAWRIMTAPGEDAPALGRLALRTAVEAAREAHLGGVHLLWPETGFAALLGSDNAARGRGGEAGAWQEWDHQAFLWTDEGYGDFPGYLEAFSKNMRRNVKREREAVRAAGIETRMIGCAEVRAGLLARMADLYEEHNSKFGPWAAKFLTRDFFLRLPEFMPSGWVVSAAFDDSSDGVPLAAAFLFEGSERLYGRYWGSRRDVNGLHFELCYYLPIQYALEKGIRSFDPGMGSSHKARRGFRSRVAPSFHLVFDKRIASLMARILPQANAEEASTVAALDRDLPFKQRNVS